MNRKLLVVVTLVATMLVVGPVSAQDCPQPTDCRLEQQSVQVPSAVSAAYDTAAAKVTQKVERKLGRAIKKQQRVAALRSSISSVEELPLSGVTQTCTNAYSNAYEQYCDEATGLYKSRSSSVYASSCCRYAFDAYGDYWSCTAALSEWHTDGDIGWGTGEGLRGRFTELPDGSVVVQRRNGQKLTFDVIAGPCEPETTWSNGSATDYQAWNSSSAERRAVSNFDHAPVAAPFYAGVSHTASSQTVWPGYEVCE